MGNAMIIGLRKWNCRTSPLLAGTLAAALFAFSPIVVGGMISTQAQARQLQCNHTLAQYVQVIKVLETQAAWARALADRNPLYESDVGYYASVLADARQCVRNLAPVATASR
jgi:hypothetical protein